MRRVLVAGVILGGLLAGCGGGDDDKVAAGGSASASGSGSGSASGSGSGSGSGSASVETPPGATGGVSSGEAGYRPASDVEAHLAIGIDVAAIKTAMEPATKDQPVDWVSVGKIFREGTGASKKGDGSIRTLQGLVPNSEQDAFINAAIDQTGDSADASDKVRRQRVEKGITVLLAEKVMEEYGKAKEKIEQGNLTPPASGAVHNVDEAYAFFVAQGHGPAGTADKRGVAFGRTDVRSGVLTAMTSAKEAALRGDKAAFEAATTATQQALDYVFYLATYQYLDSGDEVGRAEGAAFYRAISPRVEKADRDAHVAIVGAFQDGKGKEGREALNKPEVLAALGISDSEKVTVGL